MRDPIEGIAAVEASKKKKIENGSLHPQLAAAQLFHDKINLLGQNIIETINDQKQHDLYLKLIKLRNIIPENLDDASEETNKILKELQENGIEIKSKSDIDYQIDLIHLEKRHTMQKADELFQQRKIFFDIGSRTIENHPNWASKQIAR